MTIYDMSLVDILPARVQGESMNTSLGLAQYLYAVLLRLYPRHFRDEFGAEMQETFNQLSVQAAAQGKATFIAVCWRELRTAPENVVREHWRERSGRSMDTHAQELLEFKPITGIGILAALTPFLAAVAIGLGPGTAYVAVGGMVLVLLLGLVRGVPSWCLPTLGFFATILAFAGLFIWAPVFFLLPPVAEWMRNVIGNGWPWFTMALVGLIAVIATVRKPGTVLAQRARRDWIWLAFALYGSAAYWLWLAFDEYAGEQPYVIGATVTMIVAALVYLRANRPWLRYWTLLASLVLVIAIVALGRWNLVPTQTWPLTIDEGLRWGETENAIVSGVWLILAVLGPPALFKLIPQRGQSLTDIGGSR